MLYFHLRENKVMYGKLCYSACEVKATSSLLEVNGG